MTLALTALLVRGGERVALIGSGERPASGRFGIETVTRSGRPVGDATDSVWVRVRPDSISGRELLPH